jgi:ubiquinone/menaquinone biosynthesis C-methylase UbiE
MWEDGYHNIVNVDYSGILIEQMKKRHSVLRPEMEWHEMDVRHLTFEDGAFDVAIDKGTMDAMMTAKGDVWDPPQQVIDDCNSEVDETLRVLRKDGLFVYLTFGQPHFRRRYLKREGTTLEIKELGEAFHYYLYILRKNTPS